MWPFSQRATNLILYEVQEIDTVLRQLTDAREKLFNLDARGPSPETQAKHAQYARDHQIGIEKQEIMKSAAVFCNSFAKRYGR